MTAVVSRAQIVKRLKPGLAALMGKEYARYAGQYQQIFNTKKSDKSYEEMLMTVGLGLGAVKNEGGEILLDAVSDGFTARTVHSTIGLGFVLTEEAIEDNLYESKADVLGGALARSMAETKEMLAASVLNNAFDSGTPIGDGVALCSASHPLNNGSTVSNTVAADISETALKNALTAIRTTFVDDRGLKIKVGARKLVVSATDAFTAYELLKSDLSTSTVTNSTTGVTNTNNINSLRAGGLFPEGHMVYDYLTDQDSWFIMTDCQDNALIHWQRRPLKIDMDYRDPYTGNIVTTATERYSFMAGNWRGIYGSSGA
jgi:hypothetical protein